MSSDQTIQEGLCKRADFSLTISEEIRNIDKVLAPIRAVRQLSNDGSVFDHSTFAALSFDDLANLTVKLVTQLQAVKVTLRDSRSVLDDIDPISTCVPLPDSTPQLVSEISELKTTLKNFVNTKPDPLDFSKVMAAPGNECLNREQSKTKPRQSTTQQSRRANIELSKNNNVMVYDLPYTYPDSGKAIDCAQEFFEQCDVDIFHDNHDRIVDAQFISEVAEGVKTCSLRVVMSNPWVVRGLLKDAHLLKTDGPRMYKKTYVKPDRTFSEQQQHRQLVLELKDKIKSDPTTRWIIKSGKVQSGGAYNSS